MKPLAICFDLDGTVTSQEILPRIAKRIGIFEEINLLTNITLQGLIPFETSFKLRVKLLASVPITEVSQIVSETLLEKDIQQFIQQNAAICYIVTGNLDVWINDFVKKELGCNYFSSEADFEENKLLGIKKILNKGEAIKSLRQEYSKIITVGDSMNDCSMFEQANYRIAYGGVHSPVDSLVKLSDYVVYDSRSLCTLLKNLS